MSKDIKPAPFRSSEEGPAYYKAKKMISSEVMKSFSLYAYILTKCQSGTLNKA